MDNIRVSTFSNWTAPEHIVVDPADALDTIDDAQQSQLKIVLTFENDPAPEYWSDSGIEDRSGIVRALKAERKANHEKV